MEKEISNEELYKSVASLAISVKKMQETMLVHGDALLMLTGGRKDIVDRLSEKHSDNLRELF